MNHSDWTSNESMLRFGARNGQHQHLLASMPTVQQLCCDIFAPIDLLELQNRVNHLRFVDQIQTYRLAKLDE